MLTPRTFLLTFHEPGSGVLEDLRNRRRVHVETVDDVADHVAGWLRDWTEDAAGTEAEPRPDPTGPASPRA